MRSESRPVRSGVSYAWWIAAIVLACASSAASTVQAECDERNILAGLSPIEMRDVVRAHVITDGRVALPGSPYNGFESAVFRRKDAFVTYDLGRVRTIRAIFLQADNNDSYLVSVSDDGRDFEPVFLGPKAPDAGMQGRVGVDLEVRTRYVRIGPEEGDRHYSVSELAVFCKKPDPFPPSFQVVASHRPDPIHESVSFDRNLKAALALALIPVLLGMGRLRRRPRIALALVLIAIGALGWIRFGRFHEGLVIHPWDSFHYFMGTKYFGELGYTELYNCIGAYELESGRAKPILQGRVRDLATNVLHSGSWIETPEGRCKAEFTAERWKSFGADIEAFRPLFPDRLPFSRIVVDHGYNGTPPLTAFLKTVTHFTPASEAALLLIGGLDLLAYLGVAALLFWGFGPRVAAMAALVIGLGEPWSYLWTGGSVGRAFWVLFLCGGIAALARSRYRLGSVALASSALLRFFPAIFAGALGLYAIVRAIRERRLAPIPRRIVVSVLVTVVIGLLVGGVVGGKGVYPAFFRNMKNHTSLVMSNHIGFESLASFVPGVTSETASDARLTDPHEVVKRHQRDARRGRWPLWALAIGASFFLLVAYSWRKDARPWVAVILGAPLLYSSVVLSNYDYVWLVVLTPLAITSRFRVAWLMGYVASTQILSSFVANIEVKHTVLSLLTGTMIGVFVADFMRHLRQDASIENEAYEAERACAVPSRSGSTKRPASSRPVEESLPVES